MEYKVGSLFAGVGGMCLGFKKARTKKSKYKMVWANELDEYACVTYKLNFSHKLFQGDICEILNPDLIDKNINSDKYNLYLKYNKEMLEEEIDILNGGFPCQAFSIAGEQKGFEDERGNLFLNIIDLINKLGQKSKKPRVIFLENVKNIKSHDKGRTYEIIKSKLENTGYIVHEKVLNTMDYSDLPQNRERIYIIGFLYKKDSNSFDLFNDEVLKKYKKYKTPEQRASDIKKIIDYSATIQDLEKYYYTPEKYPNYFIDKKIENKINLYNEINEMYQFYQCRRGMYVRKNKSNVCPTLTANMGTGGHNVPLIKVKDGIRKLTPSETFKLQGFPIGKGYKLPLNYKNRDYADGRLYKQAGNAVSVPIIEFITNKLLELLERNDE